MKSWKGEGLAWLSSRWSVQDAQFKMLDRDWCKKRLLAKKLTNNKNPQFLSNQAEFRAILPTHELVILTKFYNNWIKIVDFIINLLFGQ